MKLILNYYYYNIKILTEISKERTLTSEFLKIPYGSEHTLSAVLEAEMFMMNVCVNVHMYMYLQSHSMHLKMDMTWNLECGSKLANYI